MKRPPIRVQDLSGTPEEIGQAHGRAFAAEITAYARERLELVAGGAWSGGPLAMGDVVEIAESMLAPHDAFHPGLHAEMLAVADGAGITPAEALVVGGFTDFVDTVRAVTGGPLPDEVTEDDCTAVIVPNDRSAGAGFLAQTWDMHDTATDHVVLLRIRPDDAPAALVFTTTGCLGQIGMNESGLAVGINNLTALDGTRGVTWPTVVRAMLTADSADGALAILLDADLAGAHNYLILDGNGVGYNVEAMPSVRSVTTLVDEPIVHTNHALHPDAAALQPPKDAGLLASSERRLATAIELLANGPIDEERLFALTREPDAICQRAVPPFNIESSGAAVMRPSTGDFWACWGRPADNDYQQVALPTTLATPSNHH